MARQLSGERADGTPIWAPRSGLDYSIPPTRIAEDGLAEAMNVVIDSGRLLPRPGLRASTRFGSELTTHPCSMAQYVLNRSTGLFTPYRAESNFGTNQLEFFKWTGAAWSSVASGLGTSRDTPPQFAQFKDEAIFLPGDGPMYRWDPSTGNLDSIDSLQSDAELRPPSRARFVVATGARVFAANGQAPGAGPTDERLSNVVWWSTSGDSTIWTNGGGIVSRRSAGYTTLQHDTYPITGLAFHSGQQVIAFKDWSLYFAQWRGSPLWYDFVPMSTRIGCVAHKTIQQWRDRLIFLGADCNVYTIDLRGSIMALGDRIQPYLEQIVDYTKLRRSVAWVDPVDNYYWLAVPTTAHGGEFARHLFCLNLNTGSWTEGEIVDTGAGILDANQIKTFAELPFFLLGGEDGRIYEWDYTNPMQDRSTDFEARVWSRVMDFMETFNQVAGTGSIHKISLHGSEGKAIGRARTGRTVPQVLASTSIRSFGEIDQDLSAYRTDLAQTPGYVSGRTYDERFGQWGILWEEGTATPMEVDGVTAWINPGGNTR